MRRSGGARAWLLLVAALAVGGCPAEETGVPDVAGTFPVQIVLVDGDCLALDPSLPPTSFLTWMGANGQAGMLDIEQDDKELAFLFEGCELPGVVSADGSFYMGGTCADEDGAAITVTTQGTLVGSADDSTKIELAASVELDVDYADAHGAAGADGTVDCRREVRLEGLSF